MEKLKTFAQFKADKWKTEKAEYPDYTRELWNYTNSHDDLINLWFDTILEVARTKQAIPAVVLDSLYKNCNGKFWRLLHDWPDYCMPPGYINPGARKANIIQASFMIEQRKKWKAQGFNHEDAKS